MTTNCTFPVIHNLEHPLVVGVLDEDPVTTQAVGRVVSESVLHRHPGDISGIRTPTETSAGWEALLSTLWDFFLSPQTLLYACDPAAEWVRLSRWFSSSTQALVPFFFSLFAVSDILCAHFFSLSAGSCKMPACRRRCQELSLTTEWSLESGGRSSTWTCPAMCAMLCTHGPHPPNTPHQRPSESSEHPDETKFNVDYPNKCQKTSVHSLSAAFAPLNTKGTSLFPDLKVSQVASAMSQIQGCEKI